MDRYKIKERNWEFHDEILGCTHEFILKTLILSCRFELKHTLEKVDSLIDCDGYNPPKKCPKKFMEEMIQKWKF